MKKLILTLALIVSFIGALSAQVEGKAIGIRFGYGGEVSYQHPLGDKNRLELDLGLNRWGFGLNGVYQWVNDLSSLADGVNWYLGVGAGIGSYNYSIWGSRKINVGILGQVGIEYNFDFPLQVSLDYRPGVFFLNGIQGSYDGICLAGRYRF